MSAATRWNTGTVIRAILASQLVIGGILVVRDLDMSWPRFAPPAPAPALDAPVRPGDQTRRYPAPSRPGGRPIPSSGDLPDRLTLARADAGGWRLEGAIAPGDADRIAPALEREAPQAVVLDSPGGSVGDALEIGRALRAAGIATAVAADGICLSACPYLLAAGTRRSVAEGGMVGVHQHFFGQSTVLPAFMAVEDVQRGQAEVMAYLADMGIDPLLMRHAMETPPDEIYLLVPEEMTQYRLVTEAEGEAEG